MKSAIYITLSAIGVIGFVWIMVVAVFKAANGS